ncbi:uncharacterized protein LOC116000322 [Ipomoea triloba]|uniref:uncharacterized protein LOC116000322 n=1 Tax=Ipomoea triloba TaxID=35885 RepID=UPI00125CFC85|nr:uncharacterized protein LOC116000322 [Ipomoea triloba]GLL27815.1 uncharacterized protein LOC109148111 [Ipomoea trifida]
MAELETAAAVNGGSTTSKDEQQNKPTNPLLALLSAFLQLFKLPSPKPAAPEEAQMLNPEPQVAKEEEKPSVVKFPRQELPSLKLEAQGPEADTNPVVLWQVYAIGGYFILRWAWTRWNERRGKKAPSNEEEPPPPNDE